jgi:hypothetical protein
MSVHPQVWQMAAGEAGRFYSDLFLRYDVMFLGPGRFGPFSSATYRNAVKEEWAGKGIVANIASFHDNVAPGDIVLMRTGHRVRGIGTVADSHYVWSETFDDVYGWDLQHTRRVAWQNHLSRELDAIQQTRPLFGDRKQIPTFTRVTDEKVLSRVRHLFPRFQQRRLNALPKALPKPLSLEDVGQELFARGVANASVDRAIAAIQRQRRLLRWYEQFGWDSKRPTEHEVVAHTVLPLLLALGWSEQLLAVEWKKIDLAAFRMTPTTANHCVLVCEAKTRHHGLQDVREQAFNYIRSLALSSCHKVLVTDGARLYLYARDASRARWQNEAVGYLNVEKIRTNHLAPLNTNAIDTIVALTPAAGGMKI